MGGSITDTTQISTRKIPSTNAPCSHHGVPTAISHSESRSSRKKPPRESHPEGIFDTLTVSQNTQARSRSMTGYAVFLPVRI